MMFVCIVALQDNEGVILVRTKTLILVACYNSSMYAGVAVEAVEKLGECCNITTSYTTSCTGVPFSTSASSDTMALCILYY